MTSDKKSVLLLFGGESSEHDVSIQSAKNVYNAAIESSKYDIKLAYISRNGKNWLLAPSFDDLDGPVLSPLLGRAAFSTDGSDEINIDILLPVLHGAHGEDGDVQGLARLLHVPCVGPSLLGAAITMNKDVTKRLLREDDIPVVDWAVWETDTDAPTYDEVCEELGSTVFIKPASAGSSVGVSKVSDEDEYKKALRLAATHDSQVLIESAVDAREIEVAVLGSGHPTISSLGEIIPGEEFYSYDDKYSEHSQSKLQIPAQLDNSTTELIRQYAFDAYNIVSGCGMARIDFFVSKDGDIFLNEINSIPGFTNSSMYPKLWEHDGVSQPDLIDRLIELSISVYNESSKLHKE